MELGQWVTWNVRGLCDSGKRRVCKHAVNKLKPLVLLLQETKLDGLRQQSLQDLASSLNMGIMAFPAEGAAGGLATMWRVGFLEVVDSISDPRFLILFVNLTGIDVLIMLVNVYGPHSGEERKIMYDDLLGLMRVHKGG